MGSDGGGLMPVSEYEFNILDNLDNHPLNGVALFIEHIHGYGWYLATQGRQLYYEMPDEDVPAAQADLIGYAARRMGVTRARVEDWSAWIQSNHVCTATKKNGQKCRAEVEGDFCGGITPLHFDPDVHLFCRWHQDPAKRGQLNQEIKPKKALSPRQKKSKTKVSGVVYLVHATDTPRYKIGLSKRVSARTFTLNYQSPYPIDIKSVIPSDDIYALEGELHDKYDPYRRHGEWFELPPSAVEEICAMGVEA